MCETAEFVEAQEQEVLEKMIEGYKKLTPQYQKVIRAMVSTLQKMQEYESVPDYESLASDSDG